MSGATSFFISGRSQKHELRKIKFNLKIESLDKIAAYTEDSFAAWNDLAGKLGGIYSGRNPPSQEFTAAQWKQIRLRDKEVIATRKDLHQAVARLRLLRADRAAKSLRSYASALGRFRDELILQRSTPNEEKFREVRNDLRKKIEKFHAELSEVYNNA